MMEPTPSEHPLQILIDRNRAWAEEAAARDPGFFTRLLHQQSPEYLWIGCADSRVPANEVVGLRSGELFVHRNVANVVVHSDLNCLSVVQFAIDQLKVRHVMVVGHHNCSGVVAALDGRRVGLADNWLRHLQDVHLRHADWLDRIQPHAARVNAFVEANAIEQALNLCQATVVQDAWARGQPLLVHGWVYALHNGLLQDLGMAVDSVDNMLPVYHRAVARVKERYTRHLQPGAATP